MATRTFLAMFTVGMAITAAAAAADGRACGNAETAIASLKSQYGETQHFAAHNTDRTNVVEVYINDMTHTYTIIVTNPASGIACLVGSGKDWEVNSGDN